MTFRTQKKVVSKMSYLTPRYCIMIGVRYIYEGFFYVLFNELWNYDTM